MKKKNNIKILKFPRGNIERERQVEAILFSAEEPLDIETIQSRLKSQTDVKKILDSFKLLCLKQKIRLINPPLEYCSDNAAMIALTCLEKYKKNVKPSINFKANPRWNICNLYKI